MTCTTFRFLSLYLNCFVSSFRCWYCGHQLPFWPRDLCEDCEDDEGGSGEGWSEGSLHVPATGIPHSWLQLSGIHWSARVPLLYVHFLEINLYSLSLKSSIEYPPFFSPPFRPGAKDPDQMGHAEVCPGCVQCWNSFHWWLLWIWTLSHPCLGRGVGKGKRLSPCWVWEAWQLGKWPRHAHKALGQSEVSCRICSILIFHFY